MGTELTQLPSAVIKVMPGLHLLIFKLLNFSKSVSVLPFFRVILTFKPN